MSKERLEEIKVAVNNYDETFRASLYGYALDEKALIDDYKWLIERVQELEEELYGNDIQMGYKRMYGVCNRDYAKLLQQNKRYREALEFINEELNLVLHTNKGLAEKMFYIENSKRKITEVLEEKI